MNSRNLQIPQKSPFDITGLLQPSEPSLPVKNAPPATLLRVENPFILNNVSGLGVWSSVYLEGRKPKIPS